MNENVILNFGGGGAALNFAVVGNPMPENPKENTIWLNTDVKITCWYFGATQPENMAEGEVWFPTGTSSSVEFNALKKNGIQVYPLSAKQMVAGALVDVTTKSYQSGEWVEWITYLVKDGVDNTDITGGWSFVNIYNGQNPGASVSNGAIKISYSPGYGLYKWEYMTKNAIDLTDVETIELICDATAKGSDYIGGDGYAYMHFNCKSSASASASAQMKLVEKGSITSKTVTLNVSGLTGKYHLSVSAAAYASNVNISINIYNLTKK